MKPQDFLAAIETQEVQPFYLFCPCKSPSGRTESFEPLLAQEVIQCAVDRFVEPSLRDLAYSVFYADEADPRDIAGTANTVPFLSEKRLVVVQRAEAYLSENTAKPILHYLENPAETTLLIFVANQIDRRSKFYKFFDKAGTVVECGELKKSEIASWARGKINSQGKSITPEALEKLVDRSGTRLSDIYNSIQIVCAYVGENEKIQLSDVETACSSVRDEEIWALTDAIAASDTSRALRVLHEILDAGTHEMQILGSINWLLESAYALAANNTSSKKLHSFAAEKIRPLARKIPLKKFPAAFSLCMETDLMLRTTGTNKTLAYLALELLIVKLSAPRTRAAAETPNSSYSP
ncbi:MAG TPA: DNA polymerase III subunit delta [Candidatus Hydrogenedentes bacterium]|nr:DNA polymerase III subunit delta [Candidatus Hydrogenedentota bacterium]HOL76484.1 DNA polymerase III subunit delta [Candidatus Hydrogenedentota bacterium]HPO85148.1 DNA polymerase III subunit delta [Candidatus Hydrogenedentota bacterium]